MASRSPPSIRIARRALCAGIALSIGTAVVAQPTGPTAIHGSAGVTQAGGLTTVTTVNGAGTRHSALDWRSFGVPQGQTVWFAQPDALSTAINRVLGGNPSSILGTLGSNGRLVLVNPAGIAFGSGAVVDTAGFTAATLPMGRADAIAGRLRFGAGDASDFARRGDDDERGGRLQVQGRVLARNGDVVLIGPDIETGPSAVVEANAGDVLIAAGQTVELTGRGLEGIRLAVRAPQGRAVNLGTLRGDSVAIFAGQLRHSGLIQALSVTTSGGRVVLEAREDAEIQGRIEAANALRGGSVQITGEALTLRSSTWIDVSHRAGGGEILVGGGLDGQDARLRNADSVEVESGVTLRADATLSGSGGTVVVWSGEETRFDGVVLARGTTGGTGGMVEVLSRERTRFVGRVDVDGDGAGSAPVPLPSGGSNGSDSGSDNSGGANNPGNAGNPGNSGRGPSRGPLPRVPLVGQSVPVQSGVAQPAGETADFIQPGHKRLAPGRGELASAFDRSAESGDADARLVGAGPGERRGQGDVIVTNTQCRPGS